METESIMPQAKEDFSRRQQHLEDLSDDLEHHAAGKGGGHLTNGRVHRGSTSSAGAKSNGSSEPLMEEDEEDEELVALANGTAAAGAGGDASSAGRSSGALAAAAHHGRLVRKAKRASRANSISEEGRFGGNSSASGAGGAGRNLKNSRKSRSGLGRGLPKKGGAGGKGTWGKLGCELELPWVDPNDPNYESDTDTKTDGAGTNGTPPGVNGSSTVGVKERKGSGNTQLKALVPEMSEEDVRKAVEALVLEYFENNDASEVLFSLQEMLMNLGSRRWMIVSLLVELAMDHKPSHREMASQLISDLYQKVISQRDIGKAFDYLLRQLPDLILDTPDAPTVLGNFMARAIADDCIPPKFLLSYKGQVEDEGAKQALRKADTLLSMKHGMVRLDNVWGVGGGVRPVKYLIKQIVMLLKEYLCSGDVQEATRCLQELEVPHFHHELVYEAVVMVIESMHSQTEEAMSKLLQSLFRSFIITIEQMRNGFERAYENMPDLSIDVPAAYVILERFVLRCRAAGFITDELVRKMPSRGRKRFVSEGDGGRIKW